MFLYDSFLLFLFISTPVCIKKCSAYTHVFADTMRSIAVLVASLLAKFTNITSEEADASATVAVSIIILIALLPLFSGLKRTAMELIEIRREEVVEKKMSCDREVNTGLEMNGIGGHVLNDDNYNGGGEEQVLFV